MSHRNKNSNFISYLVILLWLFILVFITKEQIYAIPENNSTKDQLIAEEKQKRKILKGLEISKDEFYKSTNKKAKTIEKYMIEFKEDEIIKFIYWKITNWFPETVWITSLTIWEGAMWELWFTESKIGLNIHVKNEDILIQLLKSLLNQDKYNLYIDSLSYPYKKGDRSFPVNIPIKILYK